MSVVDRSLARLLPHTPRSIARRFSARYIAGPTLDDAMRVVRELNAAGKLATVDVLGEEVTSADDAAAITAAYHELLARIAAEGLDSNISIKLTGLGLKLDIELARQNLAAVVADAAERKNFVRVDMEDSSTTDSTLRLYRGLREEGRTNVGVVLQAELRRTFDDAAGLMNVRLCKGIYVEPFEIAYNDRENVRVNYLRTLERLLRQGSYVGIATHDEELIVRAEAMVAKRGLTPDQYEFQMLYGIRADRGDQLVRDGHRLRVYVPFGTHWYEYSMRRLQENPRMARQVMSAVFRRG